MQQTENYQLNLIEKTDTFSPDALNENAQKVEDALAAVTAHAAAGDAAVTAAFQAADAALDGRVTELEAHHFVIGNFKGDNSVRTIHLGFQPLFVLVCQDNNENMRIRFATPSVPGSLMKITEDGFQVSGNSNNNAFKYSYIAFI